MTQSSKPLTLTIDEYTFVDFLQAMEKAISSGYILDLASNEGYPQAYPTRFYAGMVLKGATEVKYTDMTVKTGETGEVMVAVEGEITSDSGVPPSKGKQGRPAKK